MATSRGPRALQWLATALVASTLASSAGAAQLAVGDAVPAVSYVDITDQPGSTASRPGWIQVITFGDRDSSEAMKTWMRPAQIATTRRHPELRIAYVGFADLTTVPGLFEGVAATFVRSSFDDSNAEMKEAYAAAGVPLSEENVAFQLVPDWDGEHLAAFGLEEAESFHCWIVADGRIVEAIDGSTPAPAALYAKAFEEIATSETNGLRPPPGEGK